MRFCEVKQDLSSTRPVEYIIHSFLNGKQWIHLHKSLPKCSSSRVSNFFAFSLPREGAKNTHLYQSDTCSYNQSESSWVWICTLKCTNMNLVYLHLKVLQKSCSNNSKHQPSFTHWHAFSYTGGRGFHMRCHLLIKNDNHSQEHSHIRAIRSHLLFSILTLCHADWD